MKKSEIIVVLVACLLFAIGIPSKELSEDRLAQRQEEQAEEDYEALEAEGESYKVIYRTTSPREEKIADILWMQKAAEISRSAGIPHFNVKDKKSYKEFSSKYKQPLKVIEGTVILDNDPMAAEYDAEEILSLALTQP